jgi:hypothetical protein
MIPYILAAVGGYLIGDSMKDKQFARGGQTATWGGVRGRLNEPILSFSKVDYDVNVNPKNLEVDVNIKERDTAYNALRNVDVEWTQYHWGYMIYPRDVDELYDVLKALRTSVSKERLKRYITEEKQYADGGWITAKEVSEERGFYSDMYKDDNGVRPRSLSDEQLADWLNSNYKIVIKDYNGEKRKMIVRKPNEFSYMMLGRLQSDNDYYLGYGNRNPKRLWAGSVDAQIAEMKRLWNLLEVKPEWLTMEQIEDYEKQMKN